jgi:uncharacterized protein
MSEWAESDVGNAGRAFAGVAGVMRREYAPFATGLGVVAIHVVDDNFLQPEPGVSPVDHLVSGLVPLALLAVATIAYARVRPGIRATLALLTGFFGVVVGTEAVYYTQAVGPSGDDYTGLLSIPAGLLLLGLGGVTLWAVRVAAATRSGGDTAAGS